MGSSVNIKSIIHAKVVLPSDYHYWPSLSAKVSDNVLHNVYEPTLGYFSISLQESYLRSKNFEEELQNRQKLITQNKL